MKQDVVRVLPLNSNGKVVQYSLGKHKMLCEYEKLSVYIVYMTMAA